MLLPHRFNPDQPRISKGQDGAGRWTDDALRQEAAHPLAAPLVIGAFAVAAAFWDLYQKLSKRNSPYERAIISFNPVRRQDDKVDIGDADVRVLRRPEEVKKFCEKYGEVQDALNEIIRISQRHRSSLTPSAYGDLVHLALEQKINGPGDRQLPKDLNFRAEASLVPEERKGPNDFPVSGTKGSIRVDVYERLGNGTVCVYEIKTGEKELTYPRMEEISRRAFTMFPDTKQIIVTEVKPTQVP